MDKSNEEEGKGVVASLALLTFEGMLKLASLEPASASVHHLLAFCPLEGMMFYYTHTPIIMQ